VNEAWSTYEQRNPGRATLLGKGGITGFFVNNPSAVLTVIAFAGITSMIAYALSHDPAECKAEVQRKRLEIQQRYSPPTPAPAQPAAPVAPAPAAPAQPATPAPFGGVFNPGNLANPPAPAPAAPAPAQPAAPFGGVFNPGNLQPVAPPQP